MVWLVNMADTGGPRRESAEETQEGELCGLRRFSSFFLFPNATRISDQQRRRSRRSLRPP